MQTFPKNYGLKLGRKLTEETSLSLKRFALLGKALEGRVRAKGRKLEKCKIFDSI